MTLIKLNWSDFKGEGTVVYTKEFTEANIVTQLDMLQDCIMELSERYNELLNYNDKLDIQRQVKQHRLENK